jgi:hypothetical protein
VVGVPVVRPENHFTPADGGFSYETHTIPLPGPGDAWLEAWWVAHPQPRGVVLLFHGYAASKQVVLEPARLFYELGYSAFLVDFRGAGGSSGSTTTLGMHEAEDVAHALAYVQQTWPGQRVVLYSTSMGSAAVLRAVAVEGARPDAIIAENPFGQLTSAVRARFRLMGLPDWPTTEALVFWGGVQHGFNAFAHNPAEYARNIETPTLLLRGDQDMRVSAAELEAIFAGLQGPKQLVTVPGAGHTLLLPISAEAWQQAEQFLAHHVPAP